MSHSTKKLITEEFIKKANLKHNNKFDYSKTIYKLSRLKVVIICPIHGEFEQSPNTHLTGKHGCPKCGKEYTDNANRLSIKDFIERAVRVHKNNCDYSEVEYKNIDTKVKIFCNIHKEYFFQTPYEHFKASGCKKCKHIKISTSKLLSKEEIIIRLKQIHGNKYNYERVLYKGKNKKIEIICRVHGSFFQTLEHHCNSKVPCPKCRNQSTNKESFTKKAKEINGNRYDYSEVEYIDARTKVKIYCNECKEYFYQEPNNHLSSKQGCPTCIISKGEYKVKKFLENNNIKYIAQKRFKDCRLKNPLPFDFYVPKLNLCIEYDGEQHYSIIFKNNTERDLKEIQRRDKIKTEYCKNNDIKLLRIPYWEQSNIEKILMEELIL